MKKLVLLLFFIGVLVPTQAQESITNKAINDINKGLILKLGLNLVDRSGDDNPFTMFSDFDKMAFSSNFNVELEYRFNKWISLAGLLANNKWKANKGLIDESIVPNDIKYSSIDLDLKFYYDEALGRWFKENHWLDLYLHGGAGSVNIGDHSGITLNFGPGVNFWFSNRLGLNLNGTGKWMLNTENKLYKTNHFQYSASLMYRFVGKQPKDRDDDNDGVNNSIDECPDVFGVPKNNGCPEDINDSDGDGFSDTLDKCPEEYGTVDGCPETIVVTEADSDGDSVLDSEDYCPNIKGSPTNNGCPLLDSDNDGVVDIADKCPSVPGSPTNSGCPYGEISIGATDTHLNIESKGIYFDKGNHNFRQDSYPVLIKVAEMMKEHPEAHFRIEGHTDSSGSYPSNQRLSDRRAAAVRLYLIHSGIPSENLIAIGYGETRPVDSNLTKEGQRLNRRVEIIRTK